MKRVVRLPWKSNLILEKQLNCINIATGYNKYYMLHILQQLKLVFYKWVWFLTNMFTGPALPIFQYILKDFTKTSMYKFSAWDPLHFIPDLRCTNWSYRWKIHGVPKKKPWAQEFVLVSELNSFFLWRNQLSILILEVSFKMLIEILFAIVVNQVTDWGVCLSAAVYLKLTLFIFPL